MKSSDPLRIGILCTDQVRAELQPVHKDYPEMFRQSLHAIEPRLDIVSFDVRASVPEAVDCDAYLITGSRHSVYDNLPWIAELVDFLQQVLAARRKLIGICFGHQLMAHFFGGEVAPGPQGWGVGVHAAQVCSVRPWMQAGYVGDLSKEVRMLVSHQDQVKKLPHGAEVFLSSDFCPVSGFTIGHQVITVQGHPEFTPGYADALMQRRRQMMGESAFQSGQATLDDAVDAEVVVGWILNFLQHDEDDLDAEQTE